MPGTALWGLCSFPAALSVASLRAWVTEADRAEESSLNVRASSVCVQPALHREDGEAGRLDAGRSSAGIRVWCRQMDRCLYIRACLAPKVLPEFACPFLSSTVRPARPSALPEPSLCSHQGSASVAPVCSCGASRGGLTPVGEAPAVASSSSSRGCGTGMGSFPAGDGWHSARWQEQSGRAVVLRES